MVTSDYMDFECMHCGKLFERTWFDLSRSFERVHYNSPASLDDVEVKDAEGIGTFCSKGCLRLGSPAVMHGEGVPVPRVRPGIGPIEQCAKCSGLVDMSDWHLTYTDGCCEDELGSIKILDVDYVAVLCRDCAPRHHRAEVLTAESSAVG